MQISKMTSNFFLNLLSFEYRLNESKKNNTVRSFKNIKN
jgi:hypothetical protein